MAFSSAVNESVAGSMPPRVVFADDDPVVLATLASQLAHAFECVGTARDADQAITLVESHRPELVILDVDMPGGGAIRATREIHVRSPETAIVILSCDEIRQGVIELLNSGAVTYLRNGIDRQSLITKLTIAIKAHGRLRDTS